MRIAVFADVHSNIEALKVVLKDIKQRDVEKIYCAGDLVGYAPFPNEVIDKIKKESIPTILGNYDDGVGNMRLICGCDYKDAQAQMLGEKSILWTKEHTTEENKEFLRQLPERIKFKAGEYEVLLVHGSPKRLNEYLYEDTDEDYLLELVNEAGCDILICGHTHKPYVKELSAKKYVINAGSSGKPKHGNPNAVYALIDFTDEISVNFIEVAYDFEATAKAIENSDLPDEFAELIREGKG